MVRLRTHRSAIIRDRRALRRAFSNRIRKVTSVSISGVLALGLLGVTPLPVEAASCTAPVRTTSGNYTIVQFKTVESCSWTVPAGVTSLDFLVVAGGGGGGAWVGGGGGGGGFRGINSFTVTPGTALAVTVGAGGDPANVASTYYNGAVGTNGGDSQFGTIVAAGGGKGASHGPGGDTPSLRAYAGGSGGGGTGSSGTANYENMRVGASGNTPSTSPSQGFSGGSGSAASGSWVAGGGGGAGGAGSNGTSTTGGSGGPGASSDITGNTVFYAGGGGGIVYNSTTGAGSGGSGGGGAGTANGTGVSGTANTGGGGGGGGSNASQTSRGGAGGSGIVVVRYTTPIFTITYDFDSATGGATPPSAQFKQEGVGITLPSPTKTGLLFKGWYSDSARTTFVGRGGALYSPTASGTLYAAWTNIVLSLDASDLSSLPASPTTWTGVLPGAGTEAGTIVGNTTVATDGSIKSLNFDGNGDGVVFANSAGRVSGEMTFETWVNPSAFTNPDWHILASRWFPTAGNSSAESDFHFAMRKSGSTVKLNLWTTGSSDNFGTRDFVVSGTNKWYHVGFTIDSSNQMRFFVNGQTDSSPVSAPRTPGNNAAFIVGDNRTSAGFIGKISKVRIYNKALSASEISENFKTDAATFGQKLITFNANDGTGSPATKTQYVGTSVSTTLDANTFTRTGFTFTGWTTTAAGGGSSYTPTGAISTSSNVTLYARWTRDGLPAGIYARYIGSQYDQTNRVWNDASGNGKDVLSSAITGTPTLSTNNAANGASATFGVVKGTTAQGILFPSGVLPDNNYTLFHLTRYVDGGPYGRILQGASGNWLSGMWANNTGVAHHNAWLAPSGGPAGVGTFNPHGVKWVLSSDQNNLYRSNGVTRSGGSPSGQSYAQLCINVGCASQSESSPFEIAEIIVYNRVLSAAEIRQVEISLSTTYGLSGDDNGTVNGILTARNVTASKVFDPTTNMITNANRNTLNVSWTTPTDVTGVSDYTVDYSTSTSGPWTNFPHATINPAANTSTSLDVTGLSPGTNYYFRITPVDSGATRLSTISVTPISPGYTYTEAAPIRADGVNDVPASGGGNGGGQFIDMCPAGQVAYGLTANNASADGLGKFGLRCKAVNSDGKSFGATTSTTTLRGSATGGTTLNADCSAQALVGFQIDISGVPFAAGATPLCGSLPTGNTGSLTLSGSRVGTSYATKVNSYCPVGEVVIGVQGKEGSITDRIGVLCGYVDVISAFGSTIAASPITLTANGTSTSTITIQMKTANGLTKTNAANSLTLSGTSGSISTPVYGSNGQYTATYTSATTTGTATISGTLESTAMTNTAAVTLTPGPATQFTITDSGVTTALSGTKTAGTPFNVRITAKDANGNIATGFTGAVTLSSTAFSGSVTGTIATNGYVDAVAITPTISGASQTISASASGITSAVSSAAFAVQQPLQLTRAADGAPNAGTFAVQPVVSILSSSGTVDTSSTAQVTVSASAGATLTGTKVVSAVDGVATFTDLAIFGTIGTAYTLTYTATGTSGASQSLTIRVLPTSATISSSASSNGAFYNGIWYANSSGASTINTTSLQTALSSSNVVIQTTAGDITVSNAIASSAASTKLSLVAVGNITQNASITLSGAGTSILEKATGNITSGASVTNQTNNADIILWADSDQATSAGGYIAIGDNYVFNTQNGGSSQTSGGGKVVLAGGQDNGANGGTSGDGIPDNAAKSTTGTFGISLGSTSSNTTSKIYSGGGDIIMRAEANATGMRTEFSSDINAANGVIDIKSTGTNGHGIEIGWDGGANAASVNKFKSSGGTASIPGIKIDASTTIDAWGLLGTYTQTNRNNFLLQATGSGGISLIGSAPNTTGETRGIGLGVAGIFSATGPILIDGGARGVAFNKINSGSTGSYVDIGACVNSCTNTSVSSSSADVTIVGNLIGTANAALDVNVKTSGKVALQPVASSSFSSILTAGFAVDSSATGLTIGSASNTTSMTITPNYTINGPIDITGGNLTLNGDLVSTASGSAITMKSNGLITSATSKTFKTNKGDLIFWADSDANSSPTDYIAIGSGYTMNTANGVTSGATGGGRIVIGAGAGSGGVPTGSANSGTADKPGVGLGIKGTTTDGTIYSGGGAITIKGNSNASGMPGIAHYGKLTINSEAGRINISGTSSTGHGIEFGGYAGFASETATITSSGGDSNTPAITINGTSSSNDASLAGFQAGWSAPVIVQATGAGGLTINADSAAARGGLASGRTAFLSASGPINIDVGDQGLRTSLNAATHFIDFGSCSTANCAGSLVTSSSAAVNLSTDLITATNTNQNLRFNSSGPVSILSSGTKFSSPLTLDSTTTFGTAPSSLTVGKSTNDSNVTMNGALSVAGPITVNAGILTTGGALTSSTNSDVQFNTDQIALGAGVTSTSGIVTITPRTSTKNIDFGGADSTSLLALTDAELDRIAASKLRIGTTSGSVNFSAAMSPANTSTVKVTTTGNVTTSSTGSMAVTNFAVTGANVTLSGANAVTNLAITSSTNTVSYAQTGTNFTPATVDGVTGVYGVATKLVMNTQTPTTARSGIALTTQPVVGMQDAYNNTMLATNTTASGRTVTATLASGSGTLSNATATTSSTGVATFSGLAITGLTGSKTFAFDGTNSAGTTLTTATPSAATVLSSGNSATMTAESVTTQTVVAGTTATAPSVKIVDSAGNPVSGATINFAVTAGGGSVSSATVNTNASGIATLSSWTTGTTAGTNTVTATLSGISGSPMIFTATTTAGAATKLGIGTEPVGKASGTTLQTQPVIRIQDANGNTVITDQSTAVTVEIGSGLGGTLGGTVSVTAVNGVATFANLTLAGTVGTNYVLKFTASPTLTFVNSGNVGVNVGALSAATSTVNPGTVTMSADGVSTQTFTVTLKDAQGNTFTTTNDVVSFATNNSLGVFANATNKSPGVYEGVYTAGTSPGTDTVTVTTNSIALSTRPVITLNPGIPDTGKSQVTASLTSLTADGSSTSVVTVRLKDSSSNNIPRGGATVVVRVASGPGNVGSVTDNGNGTYSATYTATTTAGSSLIKATIGGVDIVDTETITLNPGPAAKLGLLQPLPTEVASGAILANEIQVAVQDAYGNTVTSNPQRTVSLGLIGTNGSLSGSSAASTSSGIAKFSAIRLSGITSSNYVLRFTSIDLNSVDSAPISVTPGVASTQTSVVVASENSITADGNSTAVVTVRLKDAKENSLIESGGSVVISIRQGEGSISGTTDNGDGTYSATFTTHNKVGSTEFKATLDTVTISNTVSIDLVAGNATHIAITRAPVTGANASNFTTQPQITLLDANNNTVITNSSDSVDVALITGDNGELSGTTNVRFANGVVNFTDLAITGRTNTNYVLQFAAGSFSVDSENLTLAPGLASASTSTVVATDSTLVANRLTTTTITIRLKDAQTNALTSSGGTVTVAVTTGNGSLSAVTNNNDGTYTATYTSGTVVGTETITATLGSTAISGTETINLVHGSATKIRITQAPEASASGTELAAQPKVEITDAFNNRVTTDSRTLISVAISAGSSGTLGGTATATVASGEATFTDLTLAGLVAESYKLTFSSGDLTSAESENLNVTPGAAVTSTSSISASVTSMTAAGFATSVVTVQLKDAQGNLLIAGGNSVTMRVSSGSGRIGSTTDKGNGTYTATYTSGTTSGSVSIKATLAGSDLTAVQTIALNAGTPTKLGLLVPPGSGSSGALLSPQPQIVVQDVYGNTVSSDNGRSITVTIGSGTGGSLSGDLNVDTANGIAAFTDVVLAGLTSSNYVLDFTTDDLEQISTEPLSVTSGAPQITTSTFEVSQRSIVANGATTSIVTVTLRDAQRNPLATSGGTVEMFVTSGDEGTIGITTDNNDGTYSAVYTSGTVVSDVVITAKLNGVALTNTATISLIPGAATQLVITTEPTGKASGTTLDHQPVIELLDAYGNLATQDSTTQVTTALQSGVSGTLGGTKTMTASSGVVTFTDLILSGLVSENYVLRFTSGSLILADSANVTVTPGAATTMTITAGNNTSATVNTSVAIKPSVSVQDAQGNYVPNVIVTFATGVNSGIATGTSVTTDSSGIATVGSWKLYTVAGANTMTASATGTNSVTFTSTGVAAAPDASTSSIALAAGSVVVAGSPVGITVTIRDTYSNIITDAAGTLILSATAGLGNVSAPVNNNNGSYSASFTPATLAGAETISGSYEGLTLTDQNLSVLPSAASQYLLTRTSGTIVAGDAITVEAQLADQYGNSVSTPGSAVSWSSTNEGSFSAATTDTDADGLATVTYTTNTVVASSASVSAMDTDGLSGTLTNFATVPGEAVVGTSEVITSTSRLVANGTSTATITVNLKDANGNRLTDESQSAVTISVGMMVGSVGLTTNNGDGTYSATYTTRTTVGTATISASLGIATISDTATISLDPGDAAEMRIATQPLGKASGTTLDQQPVIELLDAFGNLATLDSRTQVTAELQSGLSGLLGGTLSIAASEGVVTFTDLTVAGLTSEEYVLRFTSNGLPFIDSETFTVTPGAISLSESTLSISGDLTSLIADSSNSTTVTLTLKDAQGNQLDVGGETVGITVSTLTSGAGNFGSIGSVTDNNDGTYQATYIAGTKAQDLRFSATLSGNSIPSTVNLELVHGAATKIGLDVRPEGGASGSVLRTQPVVIIQDANGNTVTNDSGRTVTASLGGQHNSGVLSGEVTGTSNNGSVTFTGIVMTGRTSTNYVLDFTSTGLTFEIVSVDQSFTVTPGQTNPTNSLIAVSDGVITADGVDSSTVTVTIQDSEGNVVEASAGTVLLSVTPLGAGTLSTVTDNDDGTYSATFTAGTVSTTASITGTLDGVALGSTAIVSMVAGPAHHAAVLIQPGNTASGASLSPLPMIVIQDLYNNTVTADSTTIITASLKSGASGTLSGTLTSTVAEGIASFTDLSLSGVVGTPYVIEFDPNTSGVASVDSRSINLTPGTPTQLVLSTSADTAKSGQAFATQPVLIAKDAQNNIATNFTADVSATVSTGANTQGTSTQPLVNGLATFSDLGLYGTANTNYTITYTTSSLSLTTSQIILLNPGSADHLELIAQPTVEMNGRAFSTQPVIQIRDAQNNAVPTATSVNVVATISSGSGTLSGIPSIGTNESGRSTFTDLMITGNIGNYQLTFTAGGLSVESSDFELTPGEQEITRSSFDSIPLPDGTYRPTATSYSGLPVTISLASSSATICSMSDGEITFLKSGACIINFDQPGNAHWSSARPLVESLTVGKKTQNIEFAAIDDQPFGGTDVALTATADSGLPTTFTVTSASTICSLATATTVRIVGLGTCSVNVSQGGDEVWLAAANNDGNHPLTREFVIGTVRPATPTVASVSAGNEQATVSWNAPSHDGGSPLLDYKVTAHPGGASCTSTDASETSCTVSGLANGTEYRFSVQARNAVGFSNDSENSPVVTPATTADAVTGLTLTSTNRKLTANWIAPAQLGGGAFVRYELFIRETGGTYRSPFVSQNSNLETFEFTKLDPSDSSQSSDLRNGESYDVKVVVVTDAIMSGDSDAVELLGNSTEATQIPADVPDAPTDVTILTTTGHEANVSWVASNSDGGAVITAYEVSATANNVVVTCGMPTPLDTSCEIAVLTPGEQVSISVKAVNRIGRSTAATASLTLPTVPDAASMNKVTVGNGFIRVEWSAPASDGGMALTGYIARAFERGTDQIAAECTTADTSCDLILTGSDYDFDFAVWATNRVGSSARSALFSTKKPSPKPTASPTPSPSGTRTKTPVTNAGAKAVIWDARNPLYLPSGDPVELEAGKSMAWRNGEFVEVNLVAAGTSVLQLSAAGGVVLQLQSLQMSGKPMDVSATGLMQIYHNRTIRIAGSGFAPNSVATVWMFSNEIKIGEVMTDSAGAFAEVFSITQSIPLGDHTIQINGQHDDGSVRTVALGVNVMDEAFAPAEEIVSEPESNGSNQMLGVIGAVGVAFLGGLLVGLLTISQRRRKS